MSLEEKGAAMSKKNLSSILSASARIVLAFVVVFGQTASAGQNENVKGKAGASGDAKARQTEAIPTQGPERKAEATEEKKASAQSGAAEEVSQRGGPHEGIKVHGHWTIEVRNSDGSLARHVEFENSLDPGFSTTDSSGNVFVVPGGAAYLSAVASGQWSVSNDWVIFLVGPSGLSKVLTATDAPCALACQIGTVAIGYCSGGISTQPGGSCNLSVTALGTTPAFTGMRLTGSVAATQTGQVATVATLIGNLSCTASFPNCLPAGVQTASFTSSTNFPGSPISIVAGQTIAVTVNISFS
jgi:hypothetical protein